MSTSKPIIHRIGVPPQLNTLFIERHTKVETRVPYGISPGWTGTVLHKEPGFWILPISTNRDRTLGIFLKLYDDGKIERVTVREDEGDEIVIIKPADKDIK